MEHPASTPPADQKTAGALPSQQCSLAAPAEGVKQEAAEARDLDPVAWPKLPILAMRYSGASIEGRGREANPSRPAERHPPELLVRCKEHRFQAHKLSAGKWCATYILAGMAEHPQDRAQREFWGGTGRLLQATAEQESRTITCGQT